MSPSTKSVLIVGAGPSGLAALKELRSLGFDATAVDARKEIGGVFSPNSNVTFDDLHLTISNMYMAFSDFPPKDGAVKYWSRAEYFDYLQDYVKHFKLEDHVELQTMVEKATLKDDTWTITTKAGKKPLTRTFDHMIVATGANTTPKLPDSIKNFKGEVMHASQYHNNDQVKNKRVLIIGMGESAADVAHSAAASAKNVSVWTRNPQDCAPRFIAKFLEDPEYDETKYMNDYHQPKDVLESIITSRATRQLPLGVWSVALHGLVNDVKETHGSNSMQSILCQCSTSAWNKDYFSSDLQVVPTKSGMALTACAQGKIQLVISSELDQVKGSSVSWKNARIFGKNSQTDVPAEPEIHTDEFDVIVACTGYRLEFPWLETPSAVQPDARTWYKHCFPAELGDRLAMLGYARPHSGGIPQCAEMLARYVAQVWKGNLALPEKYAEIAIEEGQAEDACFHGAKHQRMLVDYVPFMNSIAKLMGCHPRAPSIFEVDRTLHYWTLPLWPCFYRLRGPGANPKAAYACLDKFDRWSGLAPMPLLGIQVLFLITMPITNGVAWATQGIRKLVFGSKTPLPRGYQWLMSKGNFLYSNSLTWIDVESAFSSWAAAVLIVAHLFGQGAEKLVSKIGVGNAKKVV